MTKTGSAAAGLAAVAATAMLAGCGSSHKAVSGVFRCLDRNGDSAEAAAVESAYRAGTLGSAAQVRADLKHLGAQPGMSTASFIRSDGSIVPWDKMTDAQQATFTLWWHKTSRVENAVARAASDAGQAARALAAKHCSR